jgi:hypothetical protein
MPILGIIASSVLKVTNSYESIATVSLGSSQTTISFSSIPSTYKHLQLRVLSKIDYSGLAGDDTNNMYFNADTTYTNYRTHRLNGNGSSVASNTVQASGYQILAAGQSTRSYTGYTSMFGGGVIDILDYADTNKNKTVRMLAGSDMNGAGDIAFHSALWMSTAAISSITINNPTGNFTQYSSFALYGIK